MKQKIKRWWRGEVRTLSIISGCRMERKTLVKLSLFWVSTFATGALLWAIGLNGYSLVTGGTMWIFGAWLLEDLMRTRFTRDGE